MLALVFINEVIFVISGPFIKVPLVFQRLRFPAFFAAQFIALAPGKEDFPAGFAFPDMQAPVGKPVQIINNQRMEGHISGNAFSPSLIVGIPEVELGIFGWHRSPYPMGDIQPLGSAGIRSNSSGGASINVAVKPFILRIKRSQAAGLSRGLPGTQILVPDTERCIHSHRTAGVIFF